MPGWAVVSSAPSDEDRGDGKESRAPVVPGFVYTWERRRPLVAGVNTKDDVHVLSDSVDTNDEAEEVVHPLCLGMDRLVCTTDAISLR